ncbi:hypothetical protein F5X99DRAFT_432956 [Biscogniauxia marginata]|nr:hypothetical protein F5X99DRAFT_432956 [Biscogniauxia marginata]
MNMTAIEQLEHSPQKDGLKATILSHQAEIAEGLGDVEKVIRPNEGDTNYASRKAISTDLCSSIPRPTLAPTHITVLHRQVRPVGGGDPTKDAEAQAMCEEAKMLLCRRDPDVMDCATDEAYDM